MYNAVFYDSRTSTVHVWDDKQGKLEIPYQQYGYQVDPKGKFETITGLKVSKVKSWTPEAVKQNMVFEHNVSPEQRVLIDLYTDSDEPSEQIVMFLDIEIAKEGKYSTPREANNTITSISYYDSKSKKYKCLLLDPESKVDDTDVIVSCSTEQEIMTKFISAINIIKPTVITGWNTGFFDLPYLYNRITNILGRAFADKLSPIKKVIVKDYEGQDEIRIAGVANMDYLKLYKSFTYSEKPRYTLDAIAKAELGRGKVEYEGDLDKLYREDIDKFIEYNLSDVELVVALDAKLDFLSIAVGICHKGHCGYDDFVFPSKFLDGASLVYCKRMNRVAAKLRSSGETGQAVGAAVKAPIAGIYEYVIDCDLTSLYPSNIMTLNMSPETIYGRVQYWDEESFASKKETGNYTIQVFTNTMDMVMGEADKQISVPASDLQRYFDENDLCIASNGVLFKRSPAGFLPSILDKWFLERKEFNKKAADFKKAGDVEQYKYYDRKQLIQKILLNSFYGVLLLPTFRFYDKRIGEAVTLTGQSIIKFSIKVANMFCNKKLGTNGIDYVICSDTDSLFLSLLPIARLSYTGDDEQTLVEEILRLANELQTTVNRAYDSYAIKLHNITQHRWDIKQEVIARRGFWGKAKKRYAMHIINKKGLPCDEIEVKGLDVVRSNFPKGFRDFMNGIIKDILDAKDVPYLNNKVIEFRKQLMVSPIDTIMLPTGVKEMSKFKGAPSGTPIHVKSALNYNKLMDLFRIDNKPKLQDGDKIIWAYLNKNSFGFETIALRGYDDPPEIVEFVKKNIDRKAIFESALLSKLTKIWEDLSWGNVEYEENLAANYF